MIESTNTLLKITSETDTSFGWFCFAMAAMYLVYALINNQYLKQKRAKLLEIKRMIEDGHERMLREKEKN